MSLNRATLLMVELNRTEESVSLLVKEGSKLIEVLVYDFPPWRRM